MTEKQRLESCPCLTLATENCKAMGFGEHLNRIYLATFCVSGNYESCERYKNYAQTPTKCTEPERRKLLHSLQMAPVHNEWEHD